MTTFITGDRSSAGVYVPLVAIEMVRALANGEGVVTGDSETGVDAMVRDIAERAGVSISTLTGFGDDFDARNAAALALPGVEVVVIHSAPESSRAIKSLLQNDDVRLVTHMDLMV